MCTSCTWQTTPICQKTREIHGEKIQNHSDIKINNVPTSKITHRPEINHFFVLVNHISWPFQISPWEFSTPCATKGGVLCAEWWGNSHIWANAHGPSRRLRPINKHACAMLVGGFRPPMKDSLPGSLKNPKKMCAFP